MPIQDIQALYDARLKSELNNLTNKKKQNIADIENQEGQTNNQYQELYNSLNQKKLDTANQYKTIYGGLDTQQQQGKEQYYSDRNSAALSNAQKVQQLRDYMAKNNLSQSGENVDALLRQNTDYSNNLGNIYNNEQQFNRGIADKRNQYSLQEQGIYNDIGNQIGAAEREKVQKLSDLTNRKRLVNEGFAGDEQALREQIGAQTLNAINEFNTQVAQRAAAARSATSRSSATQEKANKEAELNGAYAALYNNMDRGYGQDFLRQNRDGIISAFGAKVYEDMADKVAKNIPRDSVMAHAREYNMRPQNY